MTQPAAVLPLATAVQISLLFTGPIVLVGKGLGAEISGMASSHQFDVAAIIAFSYGIRSHPLAAAHVGHFSAPTLFFSGSCFQEAGGGVSCVVS